MYTFLDLLKRVCVFVLPRSVISALLCCAVLPLSLCILIYAQEDLYSPSHPPPLILLVAPKVSPHHGGRSSAREQRFTTQRREFETISILSLGNLPTVLSPPCHRVIPFNSRIHALRGRLARKERNGEIEVGHAGHRIDFTHHCTSPWDVRNLLHPLCCR